MQGQILKTNLRSFIACIVYWVITNQNQMQAQPGAVGTNNLNGSLIGLVASGGNSYVWIGQDGYTATVATVLRNPATASMYGINTITGAAGYTPTISISVAPSSNKTIAKETELNLITPPNSTAGLATLSFALPDAEEVSLLVYAIDGREVAVLYTGAAYTNTTYQLPFNTSGLPAGT